MAEGVIKHTFVSTKPDSPDASIVSSSEWNAAHFLSGGSQGQIAMRDGASTTGFSWGNAPQATQATGTYSGASPSNPLAPNVVTFTTNANLLIFVNTIAVVSDASKATIFLRKDGGTIAQFDVSGAGLRGSNVFTFVETPGTHTYEASASLSSGSFTSLNINIVTFSIGVL